MKHSFSILILCASLSAQAQIQISGSEFVTVTPAKTTGLNTVYLIRNSADATITYTGTAATVERFSRLGGGYAEPLVDLSSDGGSISWRPDPDGMGYIITDGASKLCIWVANYATAPYTISGLSVSASDCDRTVLSPRGEALPIYYYTVNGQAIEIARHICMKYTTQVYVEDGKFYNFVEKELTINHVNSNISAPAPLCDTRFSIAPGDFDARWSDSDAVESDFMSAIAVDATTWAVQTARDADNEITAESDNLGGSAPCEITFEAAVSDAAVFRRWEVSSDPDFINTDLIYDGNEFTHTFTDAGTTYVRFLADNAAGSCEYQSETYTISIGQSKLDCPNALSPGNEDGVNDLWKVSYSSIVEFHCEIYNRWGKRLAVLTDPSQGWDGKVGSKTVGPGVYFYVIKAVGSDGVKYNLSGDINVIGVKGNPLQTPVENE